MQSEVPERAGTDTLPAASPRSTRQQSILNSVWFGGASCPLSYMLFAGALVWSTYSIMYLMMRGVVLNEAVEAAQVITGAVRYPPGHPSQVFFPQAYNIFHFTSAILLRLSADTWLSSAIMDFLFTLSSTFVPFAVTVVATRRPMWGYVAGTLIVSETTVQFLGNYPMYIFPGFYSHSHIAVHAAVLMAVLLISGLWRSGGALLGLLPSLHPSIGIVVWPWAALYLVKTRVHRQKEALAKLAPAAGAGLAISLALALYTRYQALQVKLAAPYDVSAGGDVIYSQFVSATNVHAKPISVLSPAYLINPLAFFVIGLILVWTMRRWRRDAAHAYLYLVPLWLVVFGAAIWLLIYGAQLYATRVGPLPFYASLIKPFRFSNVTAVLLVPLAVAGIAAAREKMSERESTLAVALVVLLLLGEGLLIETSRVAVFNNLVYTVWGLFFAMQLFAFRRERQTAMGILAGLALVAVAILVASGPGRYEAILSLAVAFLAPLLILWAAPKLPIFHLYSTESWSTLVSAALVITCLATSTLAARNSLVKWWYGLIDVNNNYVGRWDEMSAYDQELNSWLALNADKQEMILTPVFPRSELQVKTGHPVLFEMETLFLMDFIPKLAAPIGMMVRDLYGVDYSVPDQIKQISKNGRVALDSPVWLAAWQDRTVPEWQALAGKYSFRLVLSPTSAPLQLPVALGGSEWTLYTIPPVP